MQSRRMSWVSVAAAVVLAACSAAGEDAEQPAVVAPGPAAVEVIRAAAYEDAKTVRASGLTAYKSETLLAFGAPGQLEQLLVDAGDTVRAGQRLAVLRRTTVGADAAEAEIVRQTAQQTYDRVSRLFENGAASQADVDAARLNLERSRERVTLTAPSDGVILRREVERGQIVNLGQAVLAMGEAAPGLIVRASVPSGDIGRLKAGSEATVLVRGRGALAGRIARISPKSTDSMGSFEIEVQVDEPGDLRSGEVAEVQLASDAIAGAPSKRYLVPAIALIDARADQGMVFVVDAEGRARRRAILTEGLTDAGVVVVDGIEDGDSIITRGASMLREGDAVVARPGR